MDSVGQERGELVTLLSRFQINAVQPSGRNAQMLSQLAVRLPAVGMRILLLRSHLGECLRRPSREKPRIPAEVLLTAWLDEDLASGLALKDLSFHAVPVGHATLRA